MNVSPPAIKDELREGISALQTLRDEIRVRLHLAGMEAKDKWSQLETHLVEVEGIAKEASESSRQRVTEALDKLREFRAGLTK